MIEGTNGATAKLETKVRENDIEETDLVVANEILEVELGLDVESALALAAMLTTWAAVEMPKETARFREDIEKELSNA